MKKKAELDKSKKMKGGRRNNRKAEKKKRRLGKGARVRTSGVEKGWVNKREKGESLGGTMGRLKIAGRQKIDYGTSLRAGVGKLGRGGEGRGRTNGQCVSKALVHYGKRGEEKSIMGAVEQEKRRIANNTHTRVRCCGGG